MHRWHIVILDFEGVYKDQPLLCQIANYIDLRGINEVRLMCRWEKLEFIDGLIPKFQHPVLTFLGDGMYHYLSFIFLRRISHRFVLLVVDRHVDVGPKDFRFIRCDNWLTNVLELSNLEYIIVVGKEKISDCRIKCVSPEPAQILPLLKDRSIYVSIDKDALLFPMTFWENGDLSVEELINIIETVPKGQIIGADICGEPPVEMISIVKQTQLINLQLVRVITGYSIK